MWYTKHERDVKYSHVDHEDKEHLLEARSSSDTSHGSDSERTETCRRRPSHLPYIKGNATGIVTLVLLWGLSLFAAVVASHKVQYRGNNLVQKTAAYSPVLDKFHIPLIKKKIDPTLFPEPENPDHIYRLPPSPEVDAAWERISHIGMHILTKKEVERMGKNASECTRAPPDWGYGPDKYIAEIDVFHQLHCLDALRRTNILHYDYYWGSVYGLEPPIMFESHVNHCLDILRQSIMCNANVEMLTYNWRVTQHNPFPDVGAHKVCRDFEALMRWQEEVEVKDEPAKWKKMVKPGDAVDLPMPKGLDQLDVTGYSKKGYMLKRLVNITRPDDCPNPVSEKKGEDK